jgi:ferrous iron transport protein B
MPLSPPIAPVVPATAVRTVVVAGNPNSGKSTLFNALTGLRQKVGNYPGVTVEKKTGQCRGGHGEAINLIDLPGVYSLQTRSLDEAVARDVLLGRLPDTPPPDVIVCVVDATNLERNLYLVAQLAELGLPMVVALTMVDMAEKSGLVLKTPELAAALGCPVIPVIAAQRKGLVELRQAITQQFNGVPPHRAPIPPALDAAAKQLAGLLARDANLNFRFAYAEALLLISATTGPALSGLPPHLRPALETARRQLERAGVEWISDVINARYAWVQEIAGRVAHPRAGSEASLSERLDAWLTHKIWGWVFFIGVMALMFFMIFKVAEVPMGWIADGQSALAGALARVMPSGGFRDLVIGGVVAGVGGVLVFLPQILILFFFIGLLEDTGYLARAAFIIDRLMQRVGLHGKSFVPLLNSFACAIPGIMSTRTIENPKDRLVTILVAPLMSCSARLPVYTLMIAVLFPAGFSSWKKAGVMLAMYLLGLFAAFGMAWLFRKTLFKGEHSLLLLEMPPYRRPSLRVTLARMWERAVIFLKRAGTVILAITVIIWAISTYPKPANPNATPAEALATSFAGKLGHAIEPVIAPLGYDWKIGVGIISSFAAREVFVGTMSVIYSVQDGEKNAPALRDAMLAEKKTDGSPVFTPLVCLSLLVFYVLAMQCLSTVVVVRRETNSWRWPLFQVAYMTALAWGAAFTVIQVGHWLGGT